MNIIINENNLNNDEIENFKSANWTSTTGILFFPIDFNAALFIVPNSLIFGSYLLISELLIISYAFSMVHTSDMFSSSHFFAIRRQILLKLKW